MKREDFDKLTEEEQLKLLEEVDKKNNDKEKEKAKNEDTEKEKNKNNGEDKNEELEKLRKENQELKQGISDLRYKYISTFRSNPEDKKKNDEEEEKENKASITFDDIIKEE